MSKEFYRLITAIFVVWLILFAVLNKMKEENYSSAQTSRLKIPKIAKPCMQDSLNDEKRLACLEPLVVKYQTPELKYLYAVSLYHNKQYLKCKEIFDQLLDMNDVDPKTMSKIKETYAQMKPTLSKVKEFRRRDTTGDYFWELKEVARWEDPKNLKVYISNDFDKKRLLKKAFDQWQQKAYTVVRFTYVDKKDKADIVARAVACETMQPGHAGITEGDYYHYNSNKQRIFISHSEVKVSIKMCNKAPWTDSEFLSIALHEAGHALGILSHSKNQGDIMFPTTSTFARYEISNRDLNTLKKIYMH